MATLADAGERERRGIPQWTHTLEPKSGLAKVNGKHLIVCPPQPQCVVTFVLDVRDADRFALVHDSSSEYCCHRAHNSGRLKAAQASASSVSRGSASPAQRASVSIKNTAASSLRVITWKCGGGWSPKYISIRQRLNRLTVGTVHHSARYALVQDVHYDTQTGWVASDRDTSLLQGRRCELKNASSELHITASIDAR